MIPHLRSAALLLALACLSAAWASAPDPAPAAAAAAPPKPLGPIAQRTRHGEVSLRLPAPTVRIGLSGDGRSVALSSPGGFYLVDRKTGRDLWRRLHSGTVRVVLERGAAESPPVFRVQVASLTSQEEAEALAERISQDTGEVAQVSRNPDRNAWRVRVGQRSTREEISGIEDRLRAMGFSEIWVVQEPGPGAKHPRMRLVDEDYNDLLISGQALLALPAAEGRPIRVGDQPYRGAIEVLITPGRELQAVNLLGREDYLRGVVPREMGPTVYPELEALKAQAVAARTYLEANRGQFSEDGYDICDTARCQVYGGMGAEHPLTDFAVEQTANLIATFEGKPINAMYTSTCGGHTEDLRTVFKEMSGPYLKGVSCYPDEQALAASRRTLKGAWTGPPAVMAGGERIDDALAILEVLGILAPEETSAAALASPPTSDQMGRWTREALGAAGKALPQGFDPRRVPADLAGFALYLVEAFDWTERVERLTDAKDLGVFLARSAIQATPESARGALAYLSREEILPRTRGTAGGEAPSSPPAAHAPDEPLTRTMVARALHRMLLRYEATGLLPGKHRGFRGEEIGLQSDGNLAFHRLAGRLHLVLRTDGEDLPVAEHTLQDGDNVEYHLSAAGEVDYIAARANQRGASDDRFSNLYSWETRTSREELETRIRQRASIGRLIDLQPGRRGVSGRLADLTVVGSAGRFTFYGFNIERLLGLRETLFLIDRQKGKDGKVETFIFTGKGWGHGVGLCQVGAYGMALRGKTFLDILTHYYSGVTIEPALR